MAEHGTRVKYLKEACRCRPCTDASADYHRKWRAEQRRLAALGKAVEKSVRQSKNTNKKGNTA